MAKLKNTRLANIAGNKCLQRQYLQMNYASREHLDWALSVRSLTQLVDYISAYPQSSLIFYRTTSNEANVPIEIFSSITIRP